MRVLIEVNEDGRVIYSRTDLTPSMLQEANRQANIENAKINKEPPANDKSKVDLGLLTTTDIANELKITEEDVIKLI